MHATYIFQFSIRGYKPCFLTLLQRGGKIPLIFLYMDTYYTPLHEYSNFDIQEPTKIVTIKQSVLRTPPTHRRRFPALISEKVKYMT